jgi:hypothetical protein
MIAKDGATPSRFEEERDNPFPGIGGGHHILGTGLSGANRVAILEPLWAAGDRASKAMLRWSEIMQVGYFAVGIGPTVAPEWVRTVATAAERLGFSTIWAPEHVVLLDEYASKYPYSSGKFPGPTDTPIADPFTTLAYAAACTTMLLAGFLHSRARDGAFWHAGRLGFRLTFACYIS